MVKSRSLATAAALFPIVVWVAVIAYYSVNLPWYDDFDPFPDFLRKWISGESLTERFRLLFQPNNEHRMVVGKLITLIYYWLTGHLNFIFLHFAGACFTLGTLSLFWKSFKTTGLSKWYFVPVPFLLFQLQYHLVFLWAICSLQHQPVVFFVCLSMFLLSRNQPVWALLCGICATYSMSNGIFVWPAGLVVLLLSARYRYLIVWCLVAMGAIGFYFYGLSAQGNESSFAFFAKYPHLSVLGFFAFLGGLFDFLPEKEIVMRSALPVVMGFLVSIWVVIWLLRLFVPWVKTLVKKDIKTPSWLAGSTIRSQFQLFLVGVLTFLLVNAFIIGLLRPRFGFFVMIVSNYKLYPALFLTIAYLSLISSPLRELVRNRIFKWSLAVAVGIWILSAMSYLPIIAERSKYLTVNGYNQEFNGYGLGHVPFSPAAMYVDILMKDMVAQGLYEYPAAGRQLASKVAALKIDRTATDETVRIDTGAVYLIDPAAHWSLARDRGHFAFFRNAERTYVFKLEARRYAGRNFLRQYDNGLDILVPKSSLVPGKYEAGIFRVENGQIVESSGREVTVP